MTLFIFHCYKLYHEVSTICSFNRGNITVSQCKGQYDHSRERTQSSLDKHTICDGLNLYPSDQIPVPVVPKPRNEWNPEHSITSKIVKYLQMDWRLDVECLQSLALAIKRLWAQWHLGQIKFGPNGLCTLHPMTLTLLKTFMEFGGGAKNGWTTSEYGVTWFLLFLFLYFYSVLKGGEGNG